jgi:hypothetical protein
MKELGQGATNLFFAVGPLIVNWWEFDGAYTWTAVFIGAALVGLYGELTGIRQIVAASHRMLWKQTYPGEPLD